MRGKILILTSLFALMMPLMVSAETYQLDEDTTFEFTDDNWAIFTRDNLENNPDLAGVGFTETFMKNYLNDNDMYFRALAYYQDGTEVEITVVKDESNGIMNLSNYSKAEVMQYADESAAELGIRQWGTYIGKYKYVVVAYSNSGYDILQYHTIINGNAYWFTLKKSGEMNEEEAGYMYSTVSKTVFQVDTSLEREAEAQIEETWQKGYEVGVKFVFYTLIFTIVGLILGLIVGKKARINKRKDYVK